MPTGRLKQLLTKPGLIVAPGGGTPLDMLMAVQAGFEVAFLSGNAMATSRYGVPDIGLLGLADVAATVEAIRQTTDLALMVDCDTGYGDNGGVARTVETMEMLGVASIQIEDQVWPKRCGHLVGIEVESRDVALKRVEMALKARKKSDTLIVARTDARDSQGFDEVMARMKMFAAAGAEVLFASGLKTVDEMKKLCDANLGPQMAAMTETGRSPVLPGPELEKIGYKIAVWPTSGTRIAVKHITQFYQELKKTGDSGPWLNRMATLAETNKIVGLDRYEAK